MLYLLVGVFLRSHQVVKDSMDEGKMIYNCRMWQLSGIHCVHAKNVIFFINMLQENYVPAWFETDMYYATYHHFLKPVGSMDLWPDQSTYVISLPPKPKKNAW